MSHSHPSSTHNLRADGSRLWATIHETARFGGTPKGGINRLTLSAEDGKVRDWFRDACEAAGLAVSVDALGTQYAFRPAGTRACRPSPSFASRHAADRRQVRRRARRPRRLEVMRTLNDAGIETRAPLLLVKLDERGGLSASPRR